MNVLLALGVFGIVTSSAVCLQAGPIAAHPLAETVFMASLAFTGAGVIFRRASGTEVFPALGVGAAMFYGFLSAVVASFASVATFLTVVFLLLPCVPIALVLGPLVLLWPSPEDEHAVDADHAERPVTQPVMA